MKIILFFFSFLSCHFLTAQSGRVWKTERQIPATDIYAVKNLGGKLYATSANQVFVADRWASTWRASAKFNPTPEGIDDLFSFNGKLYTTGYAQGIYESTDSGKTWRLASNGLSGRAPMRFAERKGVLYVATDDQGVQQLNAAGTGWAPFNKGLDFQTSYNFNTLINTDSCLIGGVGANGTLAVLDDQTASWDIRYHGGRILPGLTTFDLLQTGKTIWAFTNSKAFASNDGGRTWVHVLAGMRHGSVARATATSTHIFAAVNFGDNSTIIYNRRIAAPLSEAWATVDTLKSHYTYGMAYANGRLYVATQKGLISTSLGSFIEIPRFPLPRLDFYVYPNPSSGRVTLANGLAAGGGQFRLSDSRGKVAWTGPVTSDEQSLDVSTLPPGTYFYTLSGGESGDQTGRLVVEKR